MNLTQRFLNRVFGFQQNLIDLIVVALFALIGHYTLPIFFIHLVMVHIISSFTMALLGYGETKGWK